MSREAQRAVLAAVRQRLSEDSPQFRGLLILVFTFIIFTLAFKVFCMEKKKTDKNKIAIKAKKLFLRIQCLAAIQKGALEFHIVGFTRAS